MLTNEKAMKFMGVAESIAEQFSKDSSTKVAALITSMDGSPLSWGYNGMCRGVDDNVPERHGRPEKYLWFEHAERNAIYNAGRAGISLMDSRMFITSLPPCMDCARGIVQVGIREVYVQNSAFNGSERSKAWLENFLKVTEMFTEADVWLGICGPLQMYLDPIVTAAKDIKGHNVEYLR